MKRPQKASPSTLTAQQQEKLLAWINEAKEELKAKGASEADLSEEAGEGLVFQKVTEKHGAELHADKSLVAAIIPMPR